MWDPKLRTRFGGNWKVNPFESHLTTHPHKYVYFAGVFKAEPVDEMAPEGPLHLRVQVAHLTLQRRL